MIHLSSFPSLAWTPSSVPLSSWVSWSQTWRRTQSQTTSQSWQHQEVESQNRQKLPPSPETAASPPTVWLWPTLCECVLVWVSLSFYSFYVSICWVSSLYASVSLTAPDTLCPWLYLYTQTTLTELKRKRERPTYSDNGLPSLQHEDIPYAYDDGQWQHACEQGQEPLGCEHVRSDSVLCLYGVCMCGA